MNVQGVMKKRKHSGSSADTGSNTPPEQVQDSTSITMDELLSALTSINKFISIAKDRATQLKDVKDGQVFDEMVNTLQRMEKDYLECENLVEESKKEVISLTALATQAPALRRILYYLPLPDRQSLCLTSKVLNERVRENDKTFRRWVLSTTYRLINFEFDHNLPDWFLNSATPVYLDLLQPRIVMAEVGVEGEEDFWFQAIERLQDRIEGVDMYARDVAILLSHLNKCALKTLYIDIRADNIDEEHYDSKQVCSLILNNTGSLNILQLWNLILGDAGRMEVKQRMSNLEVLEISYSSANPKFFGSIVEQASGCLKEVKLTGVDCTFLNFVQSEMKKLIKVTVNAVTHEGLGNLLSKSPELESLEILYCNLDELCLTESKSLPWKFMKKLSLKGCFGGMATFQNLFRSMPNLNKVEILSCVALAPSGHVEITCSLPHLTKWHVQDSSTLIIGFNHELSTLEDFGACPNDIDSLVPLLQHDNLKRITLSGTSDNEVTLSESSATLLGQNLSHLKELTICHANDMSILDGRPPLMALRNLKLDSVRANLDLIFNLCPFVEELQMNNFFEIGQYLMTAHEHDGSQDEPQPCLSMLRKLRLENQTENLGVVVFKAIRKLFPRLQVLEIVRGNLRVDSVKDLAEPGLKILLHAVDVTTQQDNRTFMLNI